MKNDPVPAGGRAFELPSVSPDESLTMVKVLANIVNPSACGKGGNHKLCKLD